MYDVNKLIGMVYTALEDEKEMKKYCIEIRKNEGLQKDALVQIDYMNSLTAHRVGELCERSTCRWDAVFAVCDLLGVDSDCLVMAVKSMRRWENCHWKENHDCYPAYCGVSVGIRERFAWFIRKDTDELSKCYRSTGRERKYLGDGDEG